MKYFTTQYTTLPSPTAAITKHGLGIMMLMTSLVTGCGNDIAATNPTAGGSVPTSECLAGWTQCGDICVDLDHDARNCGVCGNECEDGYSCNGMGSCVLSCQSGLTACGGVCTDTSNNNSHCGSCGNSCEAGSLCNGAGTCALSCQPGLSECGGLCTSIDNDDNHCGACGNACPAGESCTGGECKTTIYESCRDVLEISPGAPSGIYWIDPSGGDPFPVYCDQTTDGGGWAIVWKNNGGAVGGISSNEQLFNATGAEVVMPYKNALISQKHEKAWQFYWDSPNREWIKIATLWDSNNNIEHEESIRVVMGSVTMQEIFSVPVSACNQASGVMRVYVNGDNFIGQTNYINRYWDGTYGLANNGHQSADDCGQMESNLINDGSLLYRIDGGTGLNTIRHLFSYVHTSPGQDASRCLYACWNADSYNGHYDAFMWAVR